MTSDSINLDDYNIITEGKANILFPKENKVFYNPVQQFNRDLSVAAIRAWDELYNLSNKKAKGKANKNKKKNGKRNENKTDNNDKENSKPLVIDNNRPRINILEALSATGLRAIRYGKEIPNVGIVIANDLLPNAVKLIEKNIKYNKIGDIVKPNLGDANEFMYKSKNKKINVIDLDPYGTAAPFIDAAINCIEDNGLLLVTCTDLAVLAGNSYPEKCFSLYGGTNIRGDSTHESALRLVINMIANTASKYGKIIEPLLSLSIDFYVRIFIKVKRSPILVKDLASKTMVCYYCKRCGVIHKEYLGRRVERENKPVKYTVNSRIRIGDECNFCGNEFIIAGPMWGDKIHDKEFVERVLKINREEFQDEKVYGTKKRIEGMLTLAKNEIEEAFYFSPATLSSLLRTPLAPLNDLFAAIGNLKYDGSLTHAQASSIKTNAPWEIIIEIFKDFIIKKNPDFNINKYEKDSVIFKIFSQSFIQDEKIKITWERNELSDRISKLRKVKIVRYQQNPTKNWGPKAKP
ncbi:tRNA (guanine26-N2)-dimethyltransferase [Ascoidea rubescens DSM 1968]|uniref:tRNA (guanine(26)-N(2))-dimethyltransferase n=1 Tax=Ascoidea rubescens DSM 1968 TaxID=1344418 RepID=A0A1D2VAD1_9ASCO|nr:guanine-N2--methyltransferase [Ascoidea rubescens DSM 1968]ODV58620.1 guanine-N2--methyltransferase [Ascoidea rubescens DSM 1968]